MDDDLRQDADGPNGDHDWPTHFEDGTPIEEGDTVIVLREVDGDIVPFIFTAGPGGRPPKAAVGYFEESDAFRTVGTMGHIRTFTRIEHHRPRDMNALE